METRDINSENYEKSDALQGLFEFNTDSKWLKYYHNVLVVSCFLTLIGGVILSFSVSNEYYAYEYFSGGYYERNMGVLFGGIILSIVIALLELVVCKVTCVNCIRKELQKKGE